jgi:hypothetical protein
MKKIFILGGLAFIIGWPSYCFISSYWVHEPDWANMILGFLLVLGPPGYTMILINGYRKARLCNRLGIDYSTAIPCYALLAIYEMGKDGFIEKKKFKTLNYVICLSNDRTFYFFDCDNTLMNNSEFNVNLTEELNSEIISIDKQDILYFKYTDKKRNAADRLVNWASNKLVAALQGLVTSRIQTQIAIDATIELHFEKNGVRQALRFGVPESMASAFSVDFISLIPFLGEVKDYISEGTETIQIFETDSSAVKRAKKLILSFIDQLSKYYKSQVS